MGASDLPPTRPTRQATDLDPRSAELKREIAIVELRTGVRLRCVDGATEVLVRCRGDRVRWHRPP
jgi:hypothetical protein